MTPRLAERLVRLEATRGGSSGDCPIVPELLRVLAIVVAIDLGGYPQPREIRQDRDTVGDAFARGLSLAHREVLGDLAAAAPLQWDALVSSAIAALTRCWEPDKADAVQAAEQA